MKVRAALRVFAVTSGAINFSKVRLPKSWRRNRSPSEAETCGRILPLASSRNRPCALVFRMASRQPVAGADQLLLFALVTFDGNEHG